MGRMRVLCESYALSFPNRRALLALGLPVSDTLGLATEALWFSGVEKRTHRRAEVLKNPKITKNKGSNSTSVSFRQTYPIPGLRAAQTGVQRLANEAEPILPQATVALEGRGMPTICESDGLLCRNAGTYSGERLSLRSSNLYGSIPTKIGLVTTLELLDLSSNQLEGTLPTEVGKLTRLLSLNVAHNRLDGSVPTELGRLCQLQQLLL